MKMDGDTLECNILENNFNFFFLQGHACNEATLFLQNRSLCV